MDDSDDISIDEDEIVEDSPKQKKASSNIRQSQSISEDPVDSAEFSNNVSRGRQPAMQVK
jgi:hypothetical protein